MLTKILYPIDLSPGSQKGLSWIANRVLQKDSQLVAVHIVDTAAGLDTPRYVNDARISLQTLCETIIAPDISCKVIVKAGNVMEDLPEIAHSENCSFAIIPVKKGDDILPLVKKIAIPQFLLRSKENTYPKEDVFTRIVIALDLSPERTDFLISSTKNILSDSDINSEITLIHGVPLENPEGSQELVRAASEALEEVREDVNQWNSNTNTKVISGQPEKELPSEIEAMDPTLLVVGLSVHGDMLGLVLGSTAEALIEKTSCPVLIIPV